MCFFVQFLLLDLRLFIDPNTLRAGCVSKGYFSAVELPAGALSLPKALPRVEPFSLSPDRKWSLYFGTELAEPFSSGESKGILFAASPQWFHPIP